jgi:23S rRNA-/tRNA-specific pseudouridylate synthase
MLEAYLITLGVKTEGGNLVHRLDRKTSGLMVLAKHKDMAAWLSQMFRDRDANLYKAYYALLYGMPQF